jgi:L-lactate dehydrogenase (cytochrome)
MTLEARYPTLSDLRRGARRRIPAYLWDYLEGGAGNEAALVRARAALDAVCLMPGVLAGTPAPDLTTPLLGRDWSRPFGIAPVGMSGAIWPDAEATLARLAAREDIPFALSGVAAATPEEVGHLTGGAGWFQLYTPSDPAIRRDILARAKAAGFGTMVMTLDAPVLSRRPREIRQQLKSPMRLTPRIVLQSALRPTWAMGMIGRPRPRPRLFDKYAEGVRQVAGDKHIGITLRCAPDWAYLEALRAEWDGPLVIKGLLDPAPVARLIDIGADAIWVSAHGGRQFEAAPAPLAALPSIRQAAGPDFPLLIDGGVQSGTDILRALALGADFVMLGRAFHHGLGAAGAAGAAHVVHVLTEELRADMAQLGIDRPVLVRDRLVR